MNQDAKQAAEKIAQARAEFLDTLRRVFDSPDGGAVLKWLHAAAATHKPSFTPGSGPIDPLAAAIRDGRKAIVLEIEENLKHARSAPGANKPKAVASPRARRKGA